jgi:hypothetical protein
MGMICMLLEASDEDIERLLRGPEQVRSLVGRETNSVYLDKAWHGIHFLLTGSASSGPEPLCYLVEGGREIGDVDLGYGPARALSAAQARSFHQALSGISREELAGRFDGPLMMREDIYPPVWDSDSERDDTIAYLLDYYDSLKSFVKGCNDAGTGIVTYIG